MYRWYASAGECYAYLADVVCERTDEGIWRVGSRSAFRNSEWFKRGWTIQELVAPKHVSFYDANWTFIGTKNDLLDDSKEAQASEPNT